MHSLKQLFFKQRKFTVDEWSYEKGMKSNACSFFVFAEVTLNKILLSFVIDEISN